MANVDWNLVEQDVDWIINAMLTSYYESKGDKSGMFELKPSNKNHIDAVKEELERHGLTVVSCAGASIGVRR